MVKTVAEQHGLHATFMPKPFAHLTGNGAHFHMSLWEAATDHNLFEDPKDKDGLGLSPMAYYFCGGLMKHAKALAVGPSGEERLCLWKVSATCACQRPSGMREQEQRDHPEAAPSDGEVAAGTLARLAPRRGGR
jgi:hypothetical protein